MRFVLRFVFLLACAVNIIPVFAQAPGKIVVPCIYETVHSFQGGMALVKRDKIVAIGLGTGMGLVQDALSNGFIGVFGMAKALTAYLAASASFKFELDEILARLALTAILVPVHGLFLFALQRGLLEVPPPFQPFDLLSSALVNVGLGLILFHLLDRFRRPA